MSRNGRPAYTGNRKRRRYARRKNHLQKQQRKEFGKSVNTSQRLKMCNSKVRYKTESGAMAKAIALMNRGAPSLRTYRCPLCGGWHLTSKPLNGQQKRN